MADPFENVKLHDVIADVGRGGRSNKPSSIRKRQVIRVTKSFFVLDDNTKLNFQGRRVPRTYSDDYTTYEPWGDKHEQIRADIRRRNEVSRLIAKIVVARDDLVTGHMEIPSGLVEALIGVTTLLAPPPEKPETEWSVEDGRADED